jgi:hypothetical protein
MTGYDSKHKMAADKLHWSDCAVHNGPAYPAGECDCGVAQEPINLLEARKIAAEYGTPNSQIDSGNLYFALMKCLEHIDAQPAQKPEYWNVIDPAGNIVASETDAIRGWARIAGSYKPTVENLLGFHDQGWRVLPKVAPPASLPAQRPWVGLTDDKLVDIWYKESLDWMEFARAHEAALKKKNFD